MREQGQGLDFIVSCQISLRLKLGMHQRSVLSPFLQLW